MSYTRKAVRTRSVAHQFHMWVGGMLALFMVVMAASGSLLLWKEDYLRWATPKAAQSVPVRPSSVLAATIDRARSHYGDRLIMVQFATERLSVDQYRLTDGGAYADPTNGRLIEQWRKNGRFLDIVFDLHHRLLAGGTGETVIGILGILSFMLVIVGLFLWWPYARLFKPKLIPDRLTRPALLKVHRDMGLVFAVPILLLSVTGTAMIFHDAAKQLLLSLTRENLPVTHKALAKPGQIDWRKALAMAEMQFPGAEIRSVSWPKASGEPAQVRLRQNGELTPQGRTVITFDPADMRMLTVTDAMQQPRAIRIFNSFHPLHAGKTWGRTYQIILTIIGVSFLALSVYAFLAFLKRLNPIRPR